MSRPFSFDLVAQRAGPEPFITVAIPQYNRRAYAELALASVFQQEGADFELLVVDDCSSDDSAEVLPDLMTDAGVPFRYLRHRSNEGYDRNVRFCLEMARGTYVLMLGNDDELAAPDTVARLEAALRGLGRPGVAVTNYEDWQTGERTRRVYGTADLGSGPETAAHFFRLFSFTSGLVFRRDLAGSHATDELDSSIYYQIYLACRIIAAGGRLAGIDLVAIRDHIRLEGELVPETYRVKYRDAPFTIALKHTGLDNVLRVAVAAISPFGEESRLVRAVALQLYLITYPHWLFEYRRVATWGHAVGVARDQWPPRQLAGRRVQLTDRAVLWSAYLASTVLGLLVPARWFVAIRSRLADAVRKARSRRSPAARRASR